MSSNPTPQKPTATPLSEKLAGAYFALSFVLVFAFPEELTIGSFLGYLLILANMSFASTVAKRVFNLND